MDRLSPFFAHFTLSARVFFSGRLCGVSSDHETTSAGHLHVLRSGTLLIEKAHDQSIKIDEPSVLFYPRPCRHRFRTEEASGAEIVCAYIEFGATRVNPLVRALPELLIVSLASVKELAPITELFFAEAFGDFPGRQAAVDRLAEYFLLLLLRAAIKEQLVEGGILTGLADPRLGDAISAMHAHPEHAWSLEELAQAARMSRARFAVHFREVMGVTPFHYLSAWRVGLAQTLLLRGESLKVVAPSVGYASSAALTRAFSQRVGISPTTWLSKES